MRVSLLSPAPLIMVRRDVPSPPVIPGVPSKSGDEAKTEAETGTETEMETE